MSVKKGLLVNNITCLFAPLFILIATGMFSCKFEEEHYSEEMNDSYVEPKFAGNENEFQVLSAKIQPPKGMVFVPGGNSKIGNIHGLGRESPERNLKFRGFFMDKHPITVREFRAFVKATGYKTQAEKFGDAAVYDIEKKQWILLKGAHWEYPLGKTGLRALDTHPVTQVSWNDAKAYCKWVGKRLPYEEEWEYAAKSAGKVNDLYWWGNEFLKDGVFHANVWNGNFPLENNAKDGYLYTSPVGKFGENLLGLQDMAGNVWQWCENKYLPYPGSQNTENMPLETEERAQRGGSFMCNQSYCFGYRVTGRSGSTAESSLFHVGFRCVKDIPINSN